MHGRTSVVKLAMAGMYLEMVAPISSILSLLYSKNVLGL